MEKSINKYEKAYSSMGRFEDKVIFLTGAATGIGEATAKRLASEGASLYMVDVAKDALEETARECSDFGVDVVSRVCDVSEESEVLSAVEEMLNHFRKISSYIAICKIHALLP